MKPSPIDCYSSTYPRYWNSNRLLSRNIACEAVIFFPQVLGACESLGHEEEQKIKKRGVGEQHGGKEKMKGGGGGAPHPLFFCFFCFLLLL